MDKAEEYRQRATEADEIAEKTSELDVREVYLSIARQWRRMAEQTERRAGLRFGADATESSRAAASG